MRFIKPIVIIAFIAGTALFVFKWASFKGALDTEPPVIHINSKLLTVDVDATDRDLMKGVQATDKKDGDVTARLVVESISKFTDTKNHICSITYGVEDSDHNVAKATRKIKYRNYTHPKFYLKKPLRIETGTDESLKDIIGATDCIDGDITRKVKILSSEFSTLSSGDSTVTAQATNKLGDTVTLKAHVMIQDVNYKAPVINLKENLAHIKKGSSFSERKYIESVKSFGGKEIPKSKVKVRNSTVNTSKEGCYYVEYVINEDKSNESVTILTVMVED